MVRSLQSWVFSLIRVGPSEMIAIVETRMSRARIRWAGEKLFRISARCWNMVLGLFGYLLTDKYLYR